MRHENRCERCEVRFEKWELYSTHSLNGGCVKVMRPINTSGRTMKQIVADAEQTWLAKAIVGNKPQAQAAERILTLSGLLDLAIGDIQWKG